MDTSEACKNDYGIHVSTGLSFSYFLVEGFYFVNAYSGAL